MAELQENVVRRSRNVDWAVHEQWKDAVNGGGTVHKRNKVSGWEDVLQLLKRSQRSAQKTIFRERCWDVGQERCSETGP